MRYNKDHWLNIVANFRKGELLREAACTHDQFLRAPVLISPLAKDGYKKLKTSELPHYSQGASEVADILWDGVMIDEDTHKIVLLSAYCEPEDIVKSAPALMSILDAVTENKIFPQSLMLPLAKSNHGKYSINFKSGKKAVTSFYNLSSNNKGALILANPKTGRTHQIRVHLKALKAPLYQDFLYNEKIDDKRLTLQCYFMKFLNPENDKAVSFKSNITNFMLNYINLLELSEKNVYQYNYETE